MDPERFDALVQSLARSGSRRRLLGGILAGSLAPLGAAAKANHPTTHVPEPAACLAVGKRCSQPASEEARPGKGKRGGKGKHHAPSCAKCCSRFGSAGADGKARCTCKGEGVQCDNDSQCCGGQCRNGSCTGCPANTVFCSDGCADLQTNDQPCGSCDTACTAGQRCQNGQCVCDEQSCPTGCCDGTNCKRGTSDSACGTNGATCQTCGAGERCDDTACVCVTGFKPCLDGCIPETDCCGGCATGEVCVSGVCAVACESPGDPCGPPPNSVGCGACRPLSAGGGNVCVTNPSSCVVTDCADCASGQVCVLALCSCPNCQVCATPCRT
jgi:hypothetical protein